MVSVLPTSRGNSFLAIFRQIGESAVTRAYVRLTRESPVDKFRSQSGDTAELYDRVVLKGDTISDAFSQISKRTLWSDPVGYLNLYRRGIEEGAASGITRFTKLIEESLLGSNNTPLTDLLARYYVNATHVFGLVEGDGQGDSGNNNGSQGDGYGDRGDGVWGT